jgi:hypothetical protein
MALGKVTVTTGAIGPGSFPAIEGVGLFIGEAAAGAGVPTPVGPGSDLATLFGAGNLADTLAIARANGGPRWKAWAIGHAAGQGWADVIDAGLAACDPELIVVCKPVAAGTELTDMQARAETLLGQARRVFFLAAFRGIDNTPTTGDGSWAAYLTAAQAITTGVAASRVLVTSLLWGGELGALAGRLARIAAERISRSPMRVRDGAVVSPGTRPVAANNADEPLTLATLEALDTARFSVFQWYEGREGVYHADGNTLEASGGDFPVVEWLRVTDKAARRVRLTAIGAVADDDVENTPAGNAAFATRLAAPLRQMVALGELRPLAKDAITVTWTSLTAVRIYMKVRPPNAPKDIQVAIALDTSSEG